MFKKQNSLHETVPLVLTNVIPGDDAVRRTAGEFQLRHGGRGDQAQAPRLGLWHLLLQELD
jgi:hypothetical protein